MPPTIHPVLLSGGAGSRLWPLSRRSMPKQLQRLVSDQTMIQETALRVAGEPGYAAPVVVCNAMHRFLIAQQLQAVEIAPGAILLEPVARNTAPAIAAAAVEIVQRDPAGLMLVMPADHVIRDRAAFLAAVQAGLVAAADGALVTFGIRPTAPATGYGYVQQGAPVPGAPGCFRVVRFTEKPPPPVAEAFVAGGQHAWNSGMFLMSAQVFLDELEAHAPAVRQAAVAAHAAAARDADFARLDEAAFSTSPSISVDYAVMERTDRAVVVPASLGWTDVGAWPALAETALGDGQGNVTVGDVVLHDTRGAYVRSEGMLTAVVGVDDAVVVVTSDAVLVTSKTRASEVKAVVERLTAAGRPEATTHRRVYRPWGWYQSVDAGERFQVKRIQVSPGHKLSLQKHHHRAEHWVVVKGTALVTRNEERLTVRENESVYLPQGAVHRLENTGDAPLELIEVQTGGYLGEDDIVRLSDDYGRA